MQVATFRAVATGTHTVILPGAVPSIGKDVLRDPWFSWTAQLLRTASGVSSVEHDF